MKIDIMTLFPEMINAVMRESIIGRAQKGGYIELHTHQLRDWSRDKHRRVDDTPYGGGMGMLMGPQPIYDCYKSLYGDGEEKPVCYEATQSCWAQNQIGRASCRERV